MDRKYPLNACWNVSIKDDRSWITADVFYTTIYYLRLYVIIYLDIN